MNNMNLQVMYCSFPTPDYPFYHVKIKISKIDSEQKINRIEANGKWLRDYFIVHDDMRSSKNILSPSDCSTFLIVRFDWCNNFNYSLSIVLENMHGEQETYHLGFKAPSNGGYWNNAWNYYASIVVREQSGLKRTNEPIHQLVAVYEDRLCCAQNESRIIEINPVSGQHREIPCQVYNESKWNSFEDEHCQPTYNFDVAFLANVMPLEQKVYLLFYGNSEAQKPQYCTDLYVHGEGFDLSIGNQYYDVKLQKESASIEDITIKQGINTTLSHKLETNGAIQWNPDIYAPPTSWNHISDWNPPQNIVIESGPIFVMVKRWGSMPMYDDVLCSSTTRFYAETPVIMLQSTVELTKDRDVIALRNGEIVLNREIVDEFAWKKPNGQISTIYINDVPRHPAMGMRLDTCTEWYSLINRERETAIGVVNIETANIRKDGGLERFDPFQYLQVGPWVYVARPLIYSFVGNNPQRMLRAYGNSISYERMAWIPYRLHNNHAPMFDWIEEKNVTLRKPLTCEFVLDTDERVPTEWIPPILLAEFDET